MYLLCNQQWWNSQLISRKEDDIGAAIQYASCTISVWNRHVLEQVSGEADLIIYLIHFLWIQKRLYHEVAYFRRHLSTLTHWGQMTHICISKLSIIDSDNGLSPGRRQAIIWTNVGLLLIERFGTKLWNIPLKNLYLKVSSAKVAAILSRPQCVTSKETLFSSKHQWPSWCAVGGVTVTRHCSHCVSQHISLYKQLFIVQFRDHFPKGHKWKIVVKFPYNAINFRVRNGIYVLVNCPAACSHCTRQL